MIRNNLIIPTILFRHQISSPVKRLVNSKFANYFSSMDVITPSGNHIEDVDIKNFVAALNVIYDKIHAKETLDEKKLYTGKVARNGIILGISDIAKYRKRKKCGDLYKQIKRSLIKSKCANIVAQEVLIKNDQKVESTSYFNLIERIQIDEMIDADIKKKLRVENNLGREKTFVHIHLYEPLLLSLINTNN